MKAVVLRVDSPGGEGVRLEQIRREVVGLKDAGKPVVVSMGDLAASGGYWISMDADRIYADPSTITGSIGIFGMIPTIPHAGEDRRVHRRRRHHQVRRRVRRHPPARSRGRAGDPERDRQGLPRFHRARGAGAAQTGGRYRRGRSRPVWTGAGKERGLVDAFGGPEDAIADAAQRAKLGKPDAYRVNYVEKAGDAVRPAVRALCRRRGDAVRAFGCGARAVRRPAAGRAKDELRFVQDAMTPGLGLQGEGAGVLFLGF